MEVKVLDHGFVKLRNISGPTRRSENMFDAHDVDPANSARMSFDQTDSGRTEEMDLKLSAYLMKNRHTSPFEMVEVWLEMKMPIFIARQFVRHRTVSINEVSGRYVTLPAEWYIPDQVGGKPVNAKQGQSDSLDLAHQVAFKFWLHEHCSSGYSKYTKSLEMGVAPEHARMLLSLNHYTHWLWKQDLHNMMHFLSLRNHSHAQVEAQEYAKAIEKLLSSVLPKTMGMYEEFRRT
jgi:thymidylate synthase (FAD)